MRFSQTAYAVNAGSTAIVTILRAGTASGAAVTYATEDGNDADPAKNAHAGPDYQAIFPTQLAPAFGSGQTSRTFPVTTLNSGVHGNRTLLLHLTSPSGEPLGQPDTATLMIFGTAQPELQVTAFSPPELAILGKSFAVPNTVRNFSGAAAGASTLQLFLSTDSTWDVSDIPIGTRSVPALVAGAASSATTMLMVPEHAAPTGLFQILAVADATGLVAEQDETNNVQAQPVILVSNFVRTYNLSGHLTNMGCSNPLRNDSMIVQGTLTFSSQAGKALTGVLTLTSPGTNYKTTGPVKATVDELGSVLGNVHVHDHRGRDGRLERFRHAGRNRRWHHPGVSLHADRDPRDRRDV